MGISAVKNLLVVPWKQLLLRQRLIVMAQTLAQSAEESYFGVISTNFTLQVNLVDMNVTEKGSCDLVTPV